MLGALIVVAGLAFVARAIGREADAARAAVAGADAAWLVVGWLAAAAAVMVNGLGWRAVLRALGDRVPRMRCIGCFFLGELGKYVPGVVWPVVGRAELVRRHGVGGVVAYGSVALSLALVYLAAAIAALALLPLGIAGDSAWWAAVALSAAIAVGLVALHPRVLGRLAAVLARLTRRETGIRVPAWRDAVLLLVRYLPVWGFVAASTVVVARALVDSPDIARISWAAIVSWIVGFVAVPAPGGVGVREAVFVAACGLPPGVGAATALIARLVFVSVDVAGAVALGPLARRSTAINVVPGVGP